MVDVESDKAGAKQLLKRSQSEPVSCAVAMSEDGKSALMVLDKQKAPRALLAQLQKDHPKVTKQIFGTAEVDEEKDSTLVRLRVNKAGGGIARRLIKTLKGTGYSKVELVLDDGSVVERAGGETEESSEAPEDAETLAATSPIPPPPPPPQPKHDAGQLTRALKALVERVAGLSDQAQRIPLLKLANEAQGRLKTNALAEAEQSIIALNRALASGLQARSQAQSPVQKLQPVWQTAKEDVDAKLDRLTSELRALDDEDANQVAEYGLFGLTSGGETVGLMKALAEYDGASGDKRAEAGELLRQAMATYRQSLEAHPIVDLLEANPFGVEIGLRSTLAGALQQIEGAIA